MSAPFDPASFQARMHDLPRRAPFRFPRGAIPSDFRRSAVLIPFWEHEGRLRVLLTKRATTMSRGAGQVSFAGGLLEGDETVEQAAVREAAEEVGLAPDDATILGRLDDAWSRTGSLLVPIVAWLPARPSWRPNPAEVAEVLEPCVDELVQPAAQDRQTVTHAGMTFTNSIVRWEGGQAYGLSADLLLEALAWGTATPCDRGRTRLSELHAYLDQGRPGPRR